VLGRYRLWWYRLRRVDHSECWPDSCLSCGHSDRPRRLQLTNGNSPTLLLLLCTSDKRISSCRRLANCHCKRIYGTWVQSINNTIQLQQVLCKNDCISVSKVTAHASTTSSRYAGNQQEMAKSSTINTYVAISAWNNVKNSLEGVGFDTKSSKSTSLAFGPRNSSGVTFFPGASSFLASVVKSSVMPRRSMASETQHQMTHKGSYVMAINFKQQLNCLITQNRYSSKI